MIPSQFSISSFVKTFFAPPEPFVSAFNVIPISFALFSRDSAAINVCAIPVGHAVTARTLIVPSSAFSSCAAGFSSSFAASSGNFSVSFLSINARYSSLLVAFNKLSLNTGSIKITDNLDNASKCTSLPSAGAAIMKNTSDGSPSIAS